MPSGGVGSKDEKFVNFVATERIRLQSSTGVVTKEELFWEVKDFSATSPSERRGVWISSVE